jgi:hypothetical protein
MLRLLCATGWAGGLGEGKCLPEMLGELAISPGSSLGFKLGFMVLMAPCFPVLSRWARRLSIKSVAILNARKSPSKMTGPKSMGGMEAGIVCGKGAR